MEILDLEREREIIPSILKSFEFYGVERLDISGIQNGSVTEEVPRSRGLKPFFIAIINYVQQVAKEVPRSRGLKHSDILSVVVIL